MENENQETLEVKNEEAQVPAEPSCCCCCNEETASVKEENAESCCCESESCCCEKECAAEEEKADRKSPRSERKPRPVIEVTQQMMDDSRKTLITMLEYLALDASIRVESKPSKINLIVSSEEAGRIIGRRGQYLENLQLILNRIMQRSNEEFPKVYIDIDGYASGKESPREGGRRRERGDRGDRRERTPRRHFDEDEGESSPHEETLRQQALDAAKEVRTFGDPKTLPSMNAHDRRIIHITLEKEEGIVTESIGEGSHRSVVISLKK